MKPLSKKHLLIPTGVCLGLTLCLTYIVTSNSSAYSRYNEENNGPRDTRSLALTSGTADVTEIQEEGDHFDPNYDPIKYWERELRPFPVGKTSTNYQWADVDGKDPAIMKQIANNPVMLESLEIENQYISKRQIIYIPEEFKQVAQGIYNGQVSEFPLPGFDGEEISVVVTQFENMEGENIDDGPLTGAWSGHLKNDPNTLIFAGSQNNYWTINYQKDGIRYTYQNREEGEWILTDINTKGELEVHGDGCGVHCNHENHAPSSSLPLTSTADHDSE